MFDFLKAKGKADEQPQTEKSDARQRKARKLLGTGAAGKAADAIKERQRKMREAAGLDD